MLSCVESYIPYFCKENLHDVRRKLEGLGSISPDKALVRRCGREKVQKI